jgi:flagellar biosynthesis protein FlhG
VDHGISQKAGGIIMAKIITIASGKGGVGKTSISLNLSLALAEAGHRVCLFDADLGLANVNILTGLFPEYGLEDVISGKHSLGEIMVKDFQGIDIIPGSSGVEKIADLSPEESKSLINSFQELSAYDYFILDTSAGISSQVLAFCRASHEMILVATPEPTSLTDAYSLLKVLSKKSPPPRIKVVINHVKTADAAKKAYARLKKTVHKFLPLKISPLGIVAQDHNVPISVVSQIPFFMLFPDTDASRCIRSIAGKLIKDPLGKADMPMELFWNHCLDFLSPQKREISAFETREVKEVGQKVDNGISTGEDPANLSRRMSSIEDKISMLLEGMEEIKALLKAGRFKDGKKDKTVAAQKIVKTGVLPKKVKPPTPRPISLDFESWEKEQSV